MNFSFEFFNTNIHFSRLGFILTPHGLIQTPAFFFCATKAALKAIDHSFIPLSRFHSALVCNTYHLALYPSSQNFNGLHDFMNWNYPIFTDSGGYQIFSMGHGSVSSEIKGIRSRVSSLLSISEEEAKFRSYVDGSIFTLSPEISIQIQARLGADLIVQLDHCSPFHISYAESKAAALRSLRWGDLSLKAYEKYVDPKKQAMYGVLQGSVYPKLRAYCLDYLLKQDFFGIAIGGSLGDSRELMLRTLKSFAFRLFNLNRPIHLLGIGTIESIFEAVLLGMDSFDCVYPTRLARHGCAIVPGLPNYRIHIAQSKFSKDYQDLDPLYPTIPHSRAYIHHLWKTNEISALSLLSLHNVLQMIRLMASIRSALRKSSSAFFKLRDFWISSS